jgi:A/G-specific adenine glycosylase
VQNPHQADSSRAAIHLLLLEMSEKVMKFTEVKNFTQDLIDWQKKSGRHDLPWQKNRTPYRVWLSEIMLQQTQVSTVLNRYDEFLKKFPSVERLGSATVDEVLAQWSGMGYYTRARNLHRCAQIVMTEYDGVFPSDPKTLESLPGIGRSTAAAIAVFSYGKKPPSWMEMSKECWQEFGVLIRI